MRHTLVAALLVGAMTAVGTDAGAQDRTWDGRGHVSVNAGQQVTTATFRDAAGFTTNLETGTFSADYGVSKGPAFDGGVTVRLWKNVGVGVAVSVFSKKDAGTFGLSVPHPLFFSRPRRASGEVSDLERRETAAHVHVAYMAPVTDRLRVLVSAGPTVFLVDQDFINGVGYSEAYPYDELVTPQARVSGDSKTKVGYNVGADVTYLIGRRWGVGGLVRFSRAKLSIGVRGQDVLGDRTVPVEAGGLQVAGGVRFGF
jgi:hypothetical protein